MNFESKSRDELAKANLLPAGTYDFEVMSAAETTSKAGNPMIKLKLRVFVDSGEIHLYDYLVSTMEFKLANFCDAVGKSDDYDAGKIDADTLEGLTGKCKIAIEDAQKDPDTGEVKWPAKNVVKTYVPGKGGKTEKADAKAKKAAATNPNGEEEMPF